MKNEPLNANGKACLRCVLAASAPFTHEDGPETAGVPSRVSDSLGSPPAHKSRPARRLTLRDQQVIDDVFRARALRGDQIRVARFSDGADSRCQLRLTWMVQEGWLSTLPRKLVTDPAVYVLSRRSIRGNRLMRVRWGDEAF